MTVSKFVLYVHTCVFPEDKLEQQHALFTQYKDPCRLGPGEDKPWALGNNTHTHRSTQAESGVPRETQSHILEFFRLINMSGIHSQMKTLEKIMHQQQKLILTL